MSAAHVLLMSALLSALPPAWAAAIPDCVGSYSFDEKEGTTVVDASPKKNDGLISGKLERVEGKFGKALKLNGTDVCIAFPQNLAQWLGRSSSFSCWIQTKAIGNKTFWMAPALAGVDEQQTNDIFWGWVDERGRYNLKAGNGASAANAKPLNDGQWHHLVLTRDMDSGAVQVFLDGTKEAQAISEKGEKSTPFYWIGRRGFIIGSVPYIQANLDEIRIYSRVLTDAEIQDLFQGKD